MLMVIVFYLLIFDSTHGRLREKCKQAGVDCFIDADCCSKQCVALSGTTFRHCSGVTEEKKLFLICIVNDHDCFENEDCCSNNCRKVRDETFGTCTPKATESAITPSTIDKNSCFNTDHFCIASDDCCSGRCSIVVSYFHNIKLHACK